MFHIVFVLTLGLILFFIMQNLSLPISNLSKFEKKYDQFSFYKSEATSGVNILFNIFISGIFILILYALFPMIDHGDLVWIVPSYILFRYTFIFLLGRFSLLKPRYELLLSCLTLLSSWAVNHFIIRENLSLSFSFENFKDELEILLTFFIYDVIKNLIIGSFDNRDITSQRKRYIYKRLRKLRNKYDYLMRIYLKYKYMEGLSFLEKDNEQILNMVYAIMIYEDFTRPKLIRNIEFIVSKFLNQSQFSLGIMQVKNKENDKNLDDENSIYSAIDILLKEMTDILSDGHNFSIFTVADRYNPSHNSEYAFEVEYIYEIVKLAD